MITRRQRLQSSYAINNEQDSPYISSQQENETYICSVGTLTRSSRLATNLDPGPSNAQLSHFYQGESSRSQPSLYSQNQQDHDCLASTNNQSCSLQSSTLSYADSLGASGSTCVDHELIASAVEQLMIGQLHIKKKRKSLFFNYFFLFVFFYYKTFSYPLTSS
jgi:hypothetical protein